MTTGIASVGTVIVLGFTFLVTVHVSRYWLLRQSGYLLFFTVVTIGCLVSFYLTTIIKSSLPLFGVGDGSIGEFLLKFTQFQPTELAIYILITFFVGVLLNCLFGRDKAAKFVSHNNGDLIEVLLQEAAENPSMVEITLTNGKSYIGYPIESGITTSNASDITVIPALSGFRDNETKKLKITTNYHRIIRQARDSIEKAHLTSFTLVLPKEQIISVRKFDLAIFLLFLDEEAEASS